MLWPKGKTLGFVAALILFALVVLVASVSIVRLREATMWIEHTHQVIRHLERMNGAIAEVEASRRGHGATGAEAPRESYRQGVDRIRSELHAARALTLDNPTQQASLDRFEIELDRWLEALAPMPDGAPAAPEAAELPPLHPTINGMIAEEERLLGIRSAAEATSARWAVGTIVSGSVLGIGLLLAAAFSTRNAMQLRLLAEGERQRFFDLSVELMVITRRGTILEANPAWERTLGYAKDAVVGTLVADLTHPDDRATSSAAAEKLERGLVPKVTFESRLKASDGSYRWLLWNAVLIPGGAEIYATAYDTTERTHAEERLQKLALDLEARNEVLSVLSEMLSLVHTCADMAEAGSILPPFLTRLLPGTAGALYATNASKNLLQSAAAWGGFAADPFSPGECWALRRGRPHRSEPSSRALCCAHVHARGRERHVCIPMLAHGEALGALVVRAPTEAVESGADTSYEPLLQRLSEALSLAIANLRLRESLRRLSVRDPLTGLFNRRYLEETLDRELSRAERQGQPLGVMMMDLDHFKRLNDTFGHEAGDEALRSVGQILTKSLRTEDVACRFGGEEFVVILPGASVEATRERAEWLRAQISAQSLFHRGGSLGPVTVSLGVAAMPDHGASPVDLLRAADAAVYRAKAEGRDRVVVAQVEPPAESARSAPSGR